MENDIKRIIDYDRNGFIIHGKHEYLIGGEFHYFRVPAAMWEDRLQKMKASGANLISVYIAWNMHEPEEGKQIWDSDYDLDRFLTLCEKYGFYVLIKPGPYICAELDFGGHPDWLIQKIARKEFRLRMLDEKYIDLCRYWYESCAQQIKPHLITNGGTIIAAQIENEYDHLIEYGEEVITTDDAIRYFLLLKQIMEENGINVPKFANEAEFLRGRDIIDTRTYYPNIPGLWMSEFERFEEKLIRSKTAQDGPVMILELQAGWFSQIGTPSYSPGLDVVEGVSKSVFITGASVVNYYMMVGGTTFPFIGGRGDVALGGYGNITSYDFGGSPIGETGELHPEKYYWLKGFMRFAREYYSLIADSDGNRLISLTSNRDDVAVLEEYSAYYDETISRAYENFTTYEEGNEAGRFFFVRNVENTDKDITIHIPEAVGGQKRSFSTTIPSNHTRMFPIDFQIGETDIRLLYSTSEIWLTKQYDDITAAVLYEANGISGELCLNVSPADIKVLEGSIHLYRTLGGTILTYQNDAPIILSTDNVLLFLLPEEMTGRVEELEHGLLLHDQVYYLEDLQETAGTIRLSMQLKEHTRHTISYFPITGASPRQAALDGTELPLCAKPSGMLCASFETSGFPDRPAIAWSSGWKYRADSNEIQDAYDHSGWTLLEHPISLEEAGFFGHGYYWYRGSFLIDGDIEHADLSFAHNDTDRYLVYLNGTLVFRSRNQSINRHNITSALRSGSNTLTVLYANEFHNKSHPHEGAIVKYSGIMNPFLIRGAYQSGEPIDISVSSFYVRYQLSGSHKGYHTPAYDDSMWQCAPETEKMVVGKDMGHLVWFRRSFRYHPAKGYHAPLLIKPIRADERLLIYVNGKPIAQYDAIGPQEEFYIPDSCLERDGENVVAIVLECPGFFEEIMSGYRRGYLYAPIVEPAYVSKDVRLEFNQ